MPGDLFSPDVIAAVSGHMNADHPEDNALICRALGTEPSTETARMTGLDEQGVTFAAQTPAGERTVRVPWATTPVERRDIRMEVVRMYRESCARLGIEPREEEAPTGRPSH
ncbi:MAG: DUF2470 domain-containing protein [Dehalococcoidia bacterium]|nr:DUF2470 domain-containing protein [Dehalococcoidia bacterium]